MPHKCMNCGDTYADGATELMEGCECGSTLFVYGKDIEDKDLDELRSDKEEIESELDQILKGAKEKAKDKLSIEFDLSSIRVEDEGVYHIDVKKLMEEIPIIAELQEDGTYYLHLPSVLSQGATDSKKLSKQDVEAMTRAGDQQ